jgi:SAM-dependent methyltransferase
LDQFSGSTPTPGRFSNWSPQNYPLYGALKLIEDFDLKNSVCLDIGTMDGLMAFSLKQAGAKEVLATDMAFRETFVYAREKLGLDIVYEFPMDVMEITQKYRDKKFDLIVFAGVLYHAFNPLSQLAGLRQILRLGGYAIIESQYLSIQRGSKLSFFPGEKWKGNVSTNTFFRPSFDAARAMIEVAGFNIIASISINERITFLVQAEKPSRIRASTKITERVLNSYNQHVNYHEIDYSILENQNDLANIVYNGKRGDFFQFRSSSSVANKLQPKATRTAAHGGAIFLIDLFYFVFTALARFRLLRLF